MTDEKKLLGEETQQNTAQEDSDPTTHESPAGRKDSSAADAYPEAQMEAGAEKKVKTAAELAGGGIASEEVRAVTPPQRPNPSNLPLLLVLLIVVIVGIGYYLLEPTPAPQQVVAVKKQPIPQRNDAPGVKEELLEPPPVAAVGEETEKQAAVDESSEEKEAVKAVAAEPQGPAEEEGALAQPADAEVPKVAPLPEVAQPRVVKPVDKPQPTAMYAVLVGPLIGQQEVAEATTQLRKLGFEPELTRGKGPVEMIRLLEGVYPPAEARKRIQVIKQKTGDAFLMPTGENLAIYVGSFHDQGRAAKFSAQLAEKGVKVSQVTSDVELDGRMLKALQADQETAQQVAKHIAQYGLRAQVLRQ